MRSSKTQVFQHHPLISYLVLFLIFSVLFVILFQVNKASAADTVTTESWSSLSAWQTITQSCFQVKDGTAMGRCQSAALQSKQTWDFRKPITVSAAVSATPANGSSTNDYWGGLTLYQDDNHYAELATERHIEPWQEDQTPHIVSLNSTSISPGGRIYQTGVAGKSYNFKISWNPTAKNWSYYINNKKVDTVSAVFTGPVRIWLLCVSVNEATPDNGSAARCRFGPVTITGTKL